MKKGTYGYLRQKRTMSLIKSILLLAAVFLIYFLALRHYHTNKNVFSILAAVMALPAARSVVVTVMCFKAVGASTAVRDLVARVPGLKEETSGFDLYLTGYDRSFSLSHAAIGGGLLAGFTEDPRTDCALCRDHIRRMLDENGRGGLRIEIFRDPDLYRKALEEIAGAPAADGEADAGDRAAMDLVRSISL